MYKRLITILLFILLCWGTARFTHHQTKGFRLSKIQNNMSCLLEDQPLDLSQEDQALFSQEFYYLGRGLQSFCFRSKDGNYVLKIFNNRHQRRLALFQFPLWRPFFKEKIATAQRKWRRSFKSYQIAEKLLHEEACLIVCAPKGNRESLLITLSDNLNIKHKIDLKDHAFVLQKFATLVYPYLEECAKAKDYPRAKKALSSLTHLIEHKMELGIEDNDPLIRTNFGFIGSEAVQIDIGPFSISKKRKKKGDQKEKMAKIFLSLRHFLEEHHPDLLPYFYETQ